MSEPTYTRAQMEEALRGQLEELRIAKVIQTITTMNDDIIESIHYNELQIVDLQRTSKGIVVYVK